ncbi:MAG: AI-2E family transporter [Actinomycetota bacterium]|nr:AI-2E family transporter [Actinomycetota bacterium]
MPTRRLVVSTYLQYILIAVGVFLLVVFVRQLSGVLLTFLMAAILAHVLNPLVRGLERWRVPRVLAVVGVFVVLGLAVVTALLVLIIPAVGQVQSLIQNPEALVERMNAPLAWARELPYVGERIAQILFATLAATALYGIIGAIFAVPVVAIVAATLRYLRNTLILEHWGKAPLVPATEEGEEPPTATQTMPSVAAGLDPPGRFGSAGTG